MIDLPSPTLIGVIHLAPLPGSARHALSMNEIIARALADARALREAGFDAAFIENYGDAPFTAESLPPASIAAIAVVAQAVREQTDKLKIGINALRNDAHAALGIAAATGAIFIRVNVHTGVYATDQGVIQGRAYETLLYRKQLGARIAILADVHVKHACPISNPDIAQAAQDAAYRGLADALIVTGPATGQPADLDEIRRVAAAVPDRRVFVGSGATVETVAELLRVASGVIVGTGIKLGRRTENPIDPNLAGAFVRAAGR
jgi:membrane complex biogenesis BtpA family protein